LNETKVLLEVPQMIGTRTGIVVVVVIVVVIAAVGLVMFIFFINYQGIAVNNFARNNKRRFHLPNVYTVGNGVDIGEILAASIYH